MSSTALGVRDLIRAATDARRWGHCQNDLGSYNTQRYDLLRQQLGVEIDLTRNEEGVSGSEEVQDWETLPLRSLLGNVMVALDQVADPFGSFLEAPVEVSELYRRHRRSLADAADATTTALIDLGADIMEKLEPGIRSRSTTNELLVAAGLPAYAPDPIDYW